MTSYLYLASIILLGIGVIRLARALMRKRSPKNPIRILVLGGFLLVCSFLLNVTDSWIAWVAVAAIVIGLFFYWRWRDKKTLPESV